SNSGYSDSDEYTFAPITGSRVRCSFNNLGKDINANPMVHGWIYEFEIWGDAQASSGLTLVDQRTFGGTGNETATGLAVVDNGSSYDVYASGGSDALNGEGLLVNYHVPYSLTGTTPGWSTQWPGSAGPDQFNG